MANRGQGIQLWQVASCRRFSPPKVLQSNKIPTTAGSKKAIISFPVWSPDSVLYFQDILAPGEPVYRFQPGTASLRRIYSFEDLLQAGAVRCAFWGFAPDGSLLVQINRGGGDLYALTVRGLRGSIQREVVSGQKGGVCRGSRTGTDKR